MKLARSKKAATVKSRKRPNKTVIKAKKVSILAANPKRRPAKKRTRTNPIGTGQALVRRGNAKKVAGGWQIGKEIVPAGSGTVQLRGKAIYLDRSSGALWSKRAANPKRKKNADHRDAAHPIHVTDYWQGRKGYKTPWQRAHEAGQKQLFSVKNGKKKNGVVSSVKKTVKAAVKGIKKVVAGKKNVTRRRNPDAAIAQRKEFAGRFNGFNDLYFPQGTPQGISKLGKLVLIKTQVGDIAPVSGTAWLCRDLDGKLHIGTTKPNAVLWEGQAGSLGEVKRLEYEESKPHLGHPNPTVWFHKMGEETGERPTLYSDGAGGLKFRGGRYRIDSRGIVN